MVVDDEGAHSVLDHPGAPVGHQLPQAVADEERVEARLPYASSVLSPGHVARDEEQVLAPVRSGDGEVAEALQADWDVGQILLVTSQPPVVRFSRENLPSV